jgi:hypothetical protein
MTLSCGRRKSKYDRLRPHGGADLHSELIRSSGFQHSINVTAESVSRAAAMGDGIAVSPDETLRRRRLKQVLV